MDYACVDHEDVRMYVQEIQTLTYKHYIQNQSTCLSLDGGILTEPFWAWRVSVQKQEKIEKKLYNISKLENRYKIKHLNGTNTNVNKWSSIKHVLWSPIIHTYSNWNRMKQKSQQPHIRKLFQIRPRYTVIWAIHWSCKMSQSYPAQHQFWPPHLLAQHDWQCVRCAMLRNTEGQLRSRSSTSS